MSHYKPYPTYKDSGVEWLGLVPEHWEVRPLKAVLETMFNGTSAEQVSPEEGALKVTRIETISLGEINLDKVGYTPKTAALSKYKLLAGDIQFSNINSLSMLGNSALFNGDSELYAGMNLLVLRPKFDVAPKWLYQVITSAGFRKQVEISGKPAINQASISQGTLGSLFIPVPCSDEQFAIASLLGRETARIDALISKKTRFIELLREKRQALITHAVTKGLDPNVKMKDSGVDWLGEVPEHWSIRPLKQLARLDGGAGFPDDEQGNKDAPIPFFKVADLANGLTTAENYITPEAAERLRAKIFPAGTIAFAKVGAALLLNRRVLMPLPGCADNNMMVALPHGVSGEWLLSVLSCFDMAWLVNPGAVPSVNQEQVGNIKIPVPSAEEQASIVAGVRSGVTRIDALVGKTERSIELLKERRSALITAAVTGQIDLRETA